MDELKPKNISHRLPQRSFDTLKWIAEQTTPTNIQILTRDGFPQFTSDQNYQVLAILYRKGFVKKAGTLKSQKAKGILVLFEISDAGKTLLKHPDQLFLTNRDYMEKTKGEISEQDQVINRRDYNGLAFLKKGPVNIHEYHEPHKQQCTLKSSQSHLSRLIRKLDWVASFKRPTDKVVVYELTPAGRAVLDRVEQGEIPIKENRHTKRAKSPQSEMPFNPEADAETDMNLSGQANQALDSISALIKQNSNYRDLFEKIQKLNNDIQKLINDELNQ